MNRRSIRGFTLLELVIALTLFALMAGVLFGSLRIATRSWDAGEARAAGTAEMRLAESFLRTQLAGQHPQRLKKALNVPLLFAGERDVLIYAAPLPTRIEGGGVYAFRLRVAKEGEKSQLTVERAFPEPDAGQGPEFSDADRTTLADDIAEIRFSYYGRDPGANDAEAPTWRDRWEDRQRLPHLVRIDVKPRKGAPWPTIVVEPREAPEAGCRTWDPGRTQCVAV